MKKRNVVSKKDKEAWKAFTDNIEDIQPKKDDLSEQSLDVNKIIEGNPDTIKTVNDVWKFSKNMWSQDPTWYLVETSQE